MKAVGLQPPSLPHNHPLQPRLGVIAARPLIKDRNAEPTPELPPGETCEASAEAYDGYANYLSRYSDPPFMPSEPGHSDMATDAELRSIKSRFAPVLAAAAQAIVGEAMSPASSAERRIAPSEVTHILEGIDRGIISFDGNRIRFAEDPLRVCSLFALNREYFLQISAFIALMTDYRYPVDRCKFEYDKLDVCVFKDSFPWIYGETKASQREAELLLEKITDRYGPTASNFTHENGRGNDALQKVKQIHKYPSLEYLWLVTPLKQWTFRIVRISNDGSTTGFSLDPVDDIPHFEE